MTQHGQNVEASLLYQVECAPFDAIDPVALRSTIEMAGFPVLHVRRSAEDFVLLVCEHVQVLIAGCNVPFAMDHFRGVSRPNTDLHAKSEVLALLAQHQASLTVLVRNRDDCPPGGDAEASIAEKQRLCCETVDLLLSATKPDLVFWSEEDLLLTAAETEAAIDGLDFDPDADTAIDFGTASTRAHAAAAKEPVSPVRVSRPLEMAQRPAEIAPNLDLYTGVSPDPSRSGIRATPAYVRPRRRATTISKTIRPTHLVCEPQLSQEALEWFAGGVEEPEEHGFFEDDLSALRAFFALDTSPEPKAISETATGRASLYLMSATIAVFALPLGASMLTYNALSGGSFRATANMMALTGVGLALTSMGLPGPAAAAAALAGF